jgi:Na+/H+ antiporter NhaD/arsenite permease-like protein
VVENKQRFRAAGIGIILLFVCLFAFHDVPAFLLVILFGFSLVLITQRKISNLFKDIEWNLIFFFITLFILVGVLTELGFMQLIGNGIVGIAGGNIVVASVAIFVFSSLAAAPLINAPVILFFLPLIQVLEGGGFALAPLAVALILGTNIGSTFLPQGAPSEMVALTISRKFNVPNFSFSRLMRTGVAFTAIHFSICLLYVVLFSVFFS